MANAGDPEQADACVAATVERFGTVDILVNNAATNPYYGPIVDITPALADKTVRVNQTGYLEWVQAAWRAGMSERGGVVLNLASIGGLSVEGGIGWYNVTKAAVIHLTSQLAGELGPGVRVNALAPGLVKTEFARALWEPGEEAIARRLPLRRLGVAEDIANAALFLCSDAASWITGHTLVIDGGALCIGRGRAVLTRSGDRRTVRGSDQLGPADLAARGPGQLGDQLDLLRGGPGGQRRRHPSADLVEGRR